MITGGRPESGFLSCAVWKILDVFFLFLGKCQIKTSSDDSQLTLVIPELFQEMLSFDKRLSGRASLYS
jgi:hypothetical protein